MNLLKDFMALSTKILTNLSSIDVSLLVDLYQYFLWLLTRLMGGDSTSHIPSSVLYVLYFSFQKEAMFEWAEVNLKPNFLLADQLLENSNIFHDRISGPGGFLLQCV